MKLLQLLFMIAASMVFYNHRMWIDDLDERISDIKIVDEKVNMVRNCQLKLLSIELMNSNLPPNHVEEFSMFCGVASPTAPLKHWRLAPDIELPSL